MKIFLMLNMSVQFSLVKCKHIFFLLYYYNNDKLFSMCCVHNKRYFAYTVYNQAGKFDLKMKIIFRNIYHIWTEIQYFITLDVSPTNNRTPTLFDSDIHQYPYYFLLLCGTPVLRTPKPNAFLVYTFSVIQLIFWQVQRTLVHKLGVPYKSFMIQHGFYTFQECQIVCRH